jgi:FkbM family methyltransferase
LAARGAHAAYCDTSTGQSLVQRWPRLAKVTELTATIGYVRRALFRLFGRLLRLFYGTRVARLIWKLPGSRKLYPFLMARLKPSTVMVLGHKLHLDDKDSLLLSVNGVYEPLESRLFEKCIKPGDVVVDVGAHIGYYTLLAARAVGPQGCVIAFEPEHGNFALLRANVAENNYSTVRCLQRALSNRSGEQTLYLSTANTGDHRLYESGDNRVTDVVAVYRLDDLVPELGPKINVVKMDVQGMELAVLEGMKGLLAVNPDMLIFTEVSAEALGAAGTGMESLLGSLESNGFHLNMVDEDRETIEATTAEELQQADDLFSSDDHINLICTKGDAAARLLQESLSTTPR